MEANVSCLLLISLHLIPSLGILIEQISVLESGP